MREPTERERTIFDALVAARPILLEHFTRDSCIASTRIALDVLDYFGIEAAELPLTVMVFNADAVDKLNSGMPAEELGALTRAISLAAPGGPWTMALGAPTGRPGWAGHLVVTVPEVGVVLDLSADQAARPHKGLDLRCGWYRITEEDWWTGRQTRAGTLPPYLHGGMLVWDRETPDPAGYLRSRNWRRRTGGEQSGAAEFRAVTGQIIRAVRIALTDAGLPDR